MERERFQSEVVASFAAGRQFGAAKATFEATNRMAIHLSLLMLYAWGGYLVSQGMMPVGVLVSGIGFTFSLMYATQGAVNTLSELRRAAGAFDRVSDCYWGVPALSEVCWQWVVAVQMSRHATCCWICLGPSLLWCGMGVAAPVALAGSEALSHRVWMLPANTGMLKHYTP